MVDVYNAPQFLNNYCCNEWAIGKKISPQIDVQNVDNIYKIVDISLKDMNL